MNVGNISRAVPPKQIFYSSKTMKSCCSKTMHSDQSSSMKSNLQAQKREERRIPYQMLKSFLGF